MLIRGSVFSIVFDPAVAGTFIGELSDLTLRQSLEAVLVPAGMDYRLDGTVVRVFPRRPETRLFDVSHLDVRRVWQRTSGSATSAQSADTGTALSSRAESDFFRDLSDGVRALLSEAGRFHVDRHAGLVQVTDLRDRLDQVDAYIEAVLLRATRQVQLHARVLEVAPADGQAIDWKIVVSRGGAGVRQGTSGALRIDDFAAFAGALASLGAVRTLAAPQLLAMNNEPAVVRVGSERARETGDGAGLMLTIVPQIAADGIVHLAISPQLTERPPPGARGTSDSAPRSIVEADTVIRVASGETALIAGLLRDESVAGGKSSDRTRTEIVLLLTPTVVTAGGNLPTGGQR
jgi:MSHA biogenesis protein MshL